MLANLVAAAVVALAAPAAHTANTSQLAGEADGIIITNVAVGQTDPNGIIPTANAVSGAGVNNVDIATPIALLSVGQSYTFTMAFHDLSYTGTCSASVKFMQMQNGKNVVLKGISFFPSDCAAGNVYLAGSNTGKFPDSPGPVTLSVTVQYGSQKAKMKTQLVLQ